MRTNHVIIWIDHKQAHVIYFDSANNEVIKSENSQPHLHHKANTVGDGNAPENHPFFHQVIHAVSDVKEILIVGPGSAKLELVKHANLHDHKIFEKIVGVETVDHPTDGQLLAYARKYFIRIDRLKAL
ncbi:MAG: translational machinery protein [Betaproteobacteria bacterium]|jgi:stalled ribosome rescue protein Dom34